MKRREINEIKNKPLAELSKVVKEKREHLRSLKFDLAAGKVKNIAEIRELKKDIARILTFINQNKQPEKSLPAAGRRISSE